MSWGQRRHGRAGSPRWDGRGGALGPHRLCRGGAGSRGPRAERGSLVVSGVSLGLAPGAGGPAGGSGDSRSVPGRTGPSDRAGPTVQNECPAARRDPGPFPVLRDPGAERAPCSPDPSRSSPVPVQPRPPPAAAARPGPAQTVNSAGAAMWLLPLPPRGRPRSRPGRPAPAQPQPRPPPPPSPATPAGGTGSTGSSRTTRGTASTGGTWSTKSSGVPGTPGVPAVPGVPGVPRHDLRQEGASRRRAAPRPVGRRRWFPPARESPEENG